MLYLFPPWQVSISSISSARSSLRCVSSSCKFSVVVIFLFSWYRIRLYGIFCTQVYYYFTVYRDRLALKLLVYLLWYVKSLPGNIILIAPWQYIGDGTRSMLYTHPIHIPSLICYGARKGIECDLVRHLLLNDAIWLTALTGRSASVSRLQLVSVMSYGRSLRVLLVYKTQGHDFFGSEY